MTSENERKPIPLPDDFPVEWENEEETQQTWHRDTHHRPDPIPPLEADFWVQSSEGWNESSKILGIERLYDGDGRCINSYLYGFVCDI